jgi:GTP-binding protein LepA
MTRKKLRRCRAFKPAQPVVFCGLFPVDNAEFEDLRDAIEKLALNDASFSFEMETSAALGFGFRCGFLGLLHLEVIRDRIEREYDIELITTAPSVIYHVYGRDGSMIELHNPADMPDPATIDHIEEPRIKATILVPDEYLGDVLKLCQDRRGVQQDLTYAGSRAMVVYDLPLNEVVFDFYDRLKSVTKGLCLVRLSDDRVPDGPLGENVRVGKRRTCRCAFNYGAHGPRRTAWARLCAKNSRI